MVRCPHQHECLPLRFYRYVLDPAALLQNVLLPGLCTATPSPNTPTTSLSTPSSAALWEDMALEPMLWVPVARPRSLPLDVGAGAVSVVNNVAKCCLHRRNRPLIGEYNEYKDTNASTTVCNWDFGKSVLYSLCSYWR